MGRRRRYRPLKEPKPIEEVLIAEMVRLMRWWQITQRCVELAESREMRQEHRRRQEVRYQQFVEVTILTHQIGFDRPRVEAKALARARATLPGPLPEHWLNAKEQQEIGHG